MAIDDNTQYSLSGAQVKDLAARVNNLKTLSGAPTTATVGTVGQLISDTTNGDLYICTAVSGSTYTWEAVGGNASPAKILTSDDYNYPTSGTKTSVALWLLEPGFYIRQNKNVVIKGSTSTGADTAGRINNLASYCYAFIIAVDNYSNPAKKIVTCFGSGYNVDTVLYATTSMFKYYVKNYTAATPTFTLSEYADTDSCNFLPIQWIFSDLDRTETKFALSVSAGKMLDNKISALSLSDAEFNTLWENA